VAIGEYMASNFCVYDKNTFDGICAAAIVKQKHRGNIETFPFIQEDTYLWERIAKDGMLSVYMIGCALPMDQMKKLADNCNFIWITHCKSDIDAALAVGMVASTHITNINKSACKLTWEFLYPHDEVPLGVEAISANTINPGIAQSKEYILGLSTYWELKPSDAVWSTILHPSSNLSYQDIVEKGRSVLAYKKNEFARQANIACFSTYFYGHRALVINGQNVDIEVFHSAACNDEIDSDLYIAFAWMEDTWVFVLYPSSALCAFDVSDIAKEYGGGGDKKRAMFTCDEIPFKLK
jgi:hypothetical protein